jgi:hypothetical protein
VLVMAACHQVSDHSEEARAFLQGRVALFWKVQFFIVLFGSGLGALGAVAQRGWDFWLTLAVSGQAGIFWWLCRRGQRSLGFSRLMEGPGMVYSIALGSAVSRYLLVGVAHDRALQDWTCASNTSIASPSRWLREASLSHPSSTRWCSRASKSSRTSDLKPRRSYASGSRRASLRLGPKTTPEAGGRSTAAASNATRRRARARTPAERST